MSPRFWSSVGLIALLVVVLALVGCGREPSEDLETITPAEVTPPPTEATEEAGAEGAEEATEATSAEPSEEDQAAETAAGGSENAAEPAPADSSAEPGPGGPGRRPEGAPAGGPPGGEGRPRRGRMFERWDADGDGALSKDEIPERAREHMMAADTNKDGKVTREELDAARERGDFGPPRRPGGEGGPGRGGPGGRGGGPAREGPPGS
jgi:hypothetical protein